MKRGGPLKRYTEMPRTGFKRKENRECVKAPGPRPVKKFSTLKAKPLERSAEWLAYSEANTKCELTRLFPKDHPIHPALDWRGLEIHHILWGQAGGRPDIPTNLIRVTAKIHDWHDANKADGLVLCLWRKHLKGELNFSELERIGGKKKYPGSLKEPTEAWIKPLWQSLLALEGT